jgi:hypothetical protein
MAADTDVGILAFTPEPWWTYWMPRHHIMSRLANYYKVLWVSPPTPWNDAVRVSPRAFLASGLHKINFSLWTYEPEKYLPLFYGDTQLNTFVNCIRIKRIKHILSTMRIKRLIIIYVWRPEYIAYVRAFQPDLVCYHVDDEYSFSFQDVPTSDLEAKALRMADVIHTFANVNRKKVYTG